jgi:hypothetical protein
VRNLLFVFVRLIGELDAVVGVLAYSQYEDGLVVDTPYLRAGEYGVEKVAAVQEGHVRARHTVYAQHTCRALVRPSTGGPWDDIPTASVRSVGVFHGVGCDVSPAGPVAVKEKIFELEHMNSVSMPSALFVEAGTDAGRFTVRAGSVKLRLPLLGVGAGGACPQAWDDAGVDIMGVLGGHVYLEAGKIVVN